MKKIINGKAYNTETATKIGEAELVGYKVDERGVILASPKGIRGAGTATLYQTTGGAYFLIVEEKPGFSASAEIDDMRYPPGWYPLRRKEALSWAEDHFDADKIEAMFGEIEEAGTGAGTLLLRLPDALKKRMQAAANDGGLSRNAWAIRCFERCANIDKVKGHLARIAYATTTWTSRPDDDAFGINHLGEIINEIERETDEITKLLNLGSESPDLITEFAGTRLLDDLVGRWKPYEES